MAGERGKKYGPKMVEFFSTLAGLSLVLYPVISICMMFFAERLFGFLARIVVGILALVGFIFLLRFLWLFIDWLNARRRDEAREKYRAIYRVLALPSEEAKGYCVSDIKVGDYGWEARPWLNDSLICLHGLSEQWGLAWIAEFRPDQIEYVCPKPVSQYDWKDFDYDGPKPRAPYHWRYVKPKNPCPFPVDISVRKWGILQYPV